MTMRMRGNLGGSSKGLSKCAEVSIQNGIKQTITHNLTPLQLSTSPVDFRFPITNQSRHCYVAVRA